MFKPNCAEDSGSLNGYPTNDGTAELSLLTIREGTVDFMPRDNPATRTVGSQWRKCIALTFDIRFKCDVSANACDGEHAHDDEITEF